MLYHDFYTIPSSNVRFVGVLMATLTLPDTVTAVLILLRDGYAMASPFVAKCHQAIKRKRKKKKVSV